MRPATRSTVRVIGTACGLGIEGSGWVAGPGLVVTNAHVVAGEDDTTVQPGGVGPRYDATAVWFDPTNDVAILRSSGIANLPALQPERERGAGHLGRGDRLPGATARSTCSPRGSARRSPP